VGIIAGLSGPSNKAIMQIMLTKMIDVQRHRDRKGELQSYIDNGIALGMVNHHDSVFCGSGLQCFSDEQYSYWSVHAFVDGIVLNTPVITDKLIDKGDSNICLTCSSIVTEAYKKWGLDFMNYLEGEFACAVWDQQEKRLILARDPYGHKPLHYYAKNNVFYFSSEIKGLLEAKVPREIDLISLSDFLSLNCVPYPATIFKDIYQVPPGSILIADHEGVRTKTYWEPSIVENHDISLEDAVGKLSAALKAAVEKRMVTPDTYCFLSGGIDSSAIVSFASEIAGKKIHAISVGFEGDEKNELLDAEVMAKHVGAEHHRVIARPESFFDMLDTLVFYHDIPFTDTSAYPTFFAAKLGCQFTDIILTGDGPDQSMGGSGHHVFALKNNAFSQRKRTKQLLAKFGSEITGSLVKIPLPSTCSKIQRKLYRDSVTPVHAAYDLRSYFPDIVKQYLCSEELWVVHVRNNPYRHPESWFEESTDTDDINKYLYADMKFYVPDDLMIKVDRMCMAHGLETLSPFQDLEIASIVSQLPGSFKINVTGHDEIKTKFILKKVCEKRFPKHTLVKRKQGFGIPLERWLKQDGGRVVKEILLDHRMLNRPYFRKESLIKFVDIFLKGKGDYFFSSPNAIAGLIILEIWHQRYID